MRVRRVQKINNMQKGINLQYQYNDNNKPEVRFFKYKYYDEDNSEYRGRIKSKFPRGAASKALTRITTTGNLIDTDIKLSIRECTKGSSHNEFHYKGRRSLLNNPQRIVLPHRTIEYKHKNFIKRYYDVREN